MKKTGKSNKINQRGRKYLRKRYQSAGAAPYALPTSLQTTSTMQNVADPERAQEALDEEVLTQREQIKRQRAEQRAEIEQLRAEREQSARQSATEALSGLQGLKKSGDLGTEAAKTSARLARRAIKQGTATGSQVAKASGDTSELLSNLGNYGSNATTAAAKGASVAGKGLAASSKLVTPIALAATAGGEALKYFGGDEDETTYNTAEISGGLLSSAGTGAGIGALAGSIIPGVGNVAGGIAGGIIGAGVGGIKMLRDRNKAREIESEREKRREEARMKFSQSYQDLFRDANVMSGLDMGYNVGSSTTNSYLAPNQMMKYGGKTLPGGKALPLPGGAVKFVGNKHDQAGKGSDSGIILDRGDADNPGIEVEGGETMDKVKFADGGSGDYIFSEHLKYKGKKSFADRHEELLKRNASQKEIQDLAKAQEKAAKKKGRDENGPRGANYIAKYGGVRKRVKYQERGLLPSSRPQTSQEKRREEALEKIKVNERYEPNVSERAQRAAQREYEQYRGPVLGPLGGRSQAAFLSLLAGDTQNNGSQPTQTTTSGTSAKSSKTKQKTAQSSSPQLNVPEQTTDQDLTGESKAIKYYQQGSNKEGLFGNATMDDVNTFMSKNSWYDFTNFDPTDPDDVKAFQEAYNEKVSGGEKVKVDGKFGDQMASAFIPEEMKPVEKRMPMPPRAEKPKQEIKLPPEKPTVETTDGDKMVGLKPPKVRDIPPLAYLGAAAQAVGPAMALATKYPQPEKIAAEMSGKKRLARVNYNAERAANANQATATNRAIQNNVSGPGAIAAMMAGNNASREQNLRIANAEAQQNTSIQNAEAQMNAQIAAQNAARQMQASAANARAQNLRDVNEYEKRLGAASALGMGAASFARDAMAYKADARVARSNQIAGEYTRQEYTEALQKRPKYRKMLEKAGIDPNDTRSVQRLAAAMYDPNMTLEEMEQAVLNYAQANPEEVKEEKKFGGKRYTKKYGSVRKNKKKK